VGAILLFGALSAFWVVLRRRRNDKEKKEQNIMSGPEAAVEPAPNDKTQGSGLAFGMAAEMPTPGIPSRPVLSELPEGVWSATPELHGDATPSTPGSVAGLSWGAGSQIQGWGAPLGTVVEERGLDYQHGHGSGETGRPDHGVVSELPA
jgi:hypothetical protein